MSTVRIALANIEYATTPEESVSSSDRAIADAAAAEAGLVCFPECFVPGYRSPTRQVPPPDPAFLERAWAAIERAAAKARIAVILGTERVADGQRPVMSALVINADGTPAGFQDKNQIDP